MPDLPKIYFFCYQYPPIARTRGRQIIVKSFYDAGFPAKVITVANPQGYFNKIILDKSLINEKSAGIEVERIKVLKWGIFGELFYLAKLLPDPRMNWLWAVKKKNQNIVDTNLGVIFALYPPIVNFMAAMHYKKITGFPLVLDYRDEFLNLFAPQDDSKREKFFAIEKEIIDAADVISVASSQIKENLIERYEVDESKFIHCYSGYQNLNFSLDTSTEKNSSFETENKLKIVYSGAISQHQKPEIIIFAYQKLVEKHPELRGKINITFYGPENYYFKYFVKKYFGDGITYGGFLPQSQIDAELQSYDVGFFSLASEKYSYAIPRKLFDYINLELPILAAIPHGEAWNLVEENKIGRQVHFSQIDELADAIYELYKNRNYLSDVRKNIRLIKNKFSAEYQYGRLAERIKELSFGQ